MKKKITSRQLQAQKTKDRIYSTALRLMKTKGFDNVTIEDIISEAQVSVGTFYNYFSSKNAIIEELYKNSSDWITNHYQTKLTEESAIDQILEHFSFYCEFQKLQGIDIVKIKYFQNVHVDPPKDRFPLSIVDDIIRSGQFKNEIITDVSAEYITNYLFIVVRGILLDWCRHNGNYDLTEFTNQFLRKLLPVFMQQKQTL